MGKVYIIDKFGNRHLESDVQKILDETIDDFKNNGGKELIKEAWLDLLLNGTRIESMSLDETIDRYGYALTEEQIKKLKEYTKPNG